MQTEDELKPTIVTVPAGRGSGTGGLVLPDRTPIILHVVTPIMIILVRSARVFLQSLLGLITAGAVAPQALPAADFLHLLALCASLSLAPTGVCVLQNMIELLTKLDQAHPTLSV